MTNNETTTETAYRNALLAVLKSTTGANVPPGLIDQPKLVAELLADRFKHLSGAEESVAGLMELSVELANRGDRWKKLAGRAYDTLTGEPSKEWRTAAELGEEIIAGMEFEDSSGEEHPQLQDFEYSMIAAREVLPYDSPATYRERYAKACSFTASEQMAKRIQDSFKDAQKEDRAKSPIIGASNADIIRGLS